MQGSRKAVRKMSGLMWLPLSTCAGSNLSGQVRIWGSLPEISRLDYLSLLCLPYDSAVA